MNLAQRHVHLKLVDDFESRKSRNSSYSLRSFSMKVGIGPGALSQIINGKRKLTKKMALRIAHSLMWEPNEIEEIEELYDGKTSLEKIDDLAKEETYQLPQNAFKISADPIYYSILSLMETENFQSDYMWIASRLGKPVQTIERAVKLLIECGFIGTSDDNHLFLKKQSLRTTDDIRSMALRKRQHNNLEDAHHALDQVSVELREFSSMTMAIDMKRLPEAKKIIREFQEKLCSYLEEGDQEEVYELAVQLFPRTHIEENKNIYTGEKQ